MNQKQVVLGFSGGLDTTFCVKWLQEHGYEPICVTLDIGQEPDIEAIRRKATQLGVKTIRIIDGKNDFVRYFVTPALKANALYQGVYPLATALSRPFIAKVMADVAKELGTKYLAHGCTGKGNDQVRIELALRSLIPDCQIIDPIRSENLSRDEEIKYLESKGIQTGITQAKPYSVDQNLWGRSVCAGILENISVEPPPEVYEWTQAVEKTPQDPEEVEVKFTSGVPTALNGSSLSLPDIICKLNEVGGKHGIGRIDHIEDRLVGIKSRELYEAPAAIILIKAHQILESMTLSRSALEFKRQVDHEYASLVYFGNWFSHHHMDLLSYLHYNQKHVTGTIKIKLYKGNCIIAGRSSDFSLYQKSLATYGPESIFDQAAAEGFVKILGIENETLSRAQLFNFKEMQHLLSEKNEDSKE